MIRCFALLLLLAGAALPQTINQKVDNLFESMDTTVSPGCALAVIRDGQVVYKRGYGMADLDHDIPIRPDSVFHVASVSKQFTAAAIVLLEQEGKLSLDDPVRKYVPELPDFGAPITIRHLIHHTSGLRDQWDLLGLAGWRYSLDLITDNDVLELMARQRDLNFRPGEKHLYCNTGYTLLAQIVKRVSGKSFREFTTERIFRPLSMNSTHFRDDHAEVVRRQAYGYSSRRTGEYRLSITNFDTVGATSLLTTVEDLALWDQNFYEPHVGGKEFTTRMLQRGKLNSGKDLDYAFGLTVGTYRGLPIVDHSGGDAGYRSDLLRFPDQRFSVACLCNLAGSNPTLLTRRVADVYLEKEFKEPAGAPGQLARDTIALSEAQLSPLAGFYWSKEEAQAIRVAMKDGKLSFLPSPTESIPLNPVAVDRFRMAGLPIAVSFERTGASRRMLVKRDSADIPDIFEEAAEFLPDPAQLAAFAGDYQGEEIEAIYRMVIEDGGLVLKRLKSNPDKLRPTVADCFRGEFGNIRFLRDAGERVTGFVLSAGRVKNVRFRRTR